MADTLHISAEITEAVPNIVSAAVAVTAGKMHLGSHEEARARLQLDDPAAVSYFRFEVARQIATLLLASDQFVIAVYEEQDVPDSEELSPAAVSLHAPLRLYVLVERDTAALRSLIASLDDALADTLAAQFGGPLAPVLDTIVIEESEATRLRPRAYGYRPAPALLVSREALQANEACSSPETTCSKLPV